MITLMKFVAGLVSNALTQTVRCLWNLTACLARLGLSLLCAFMATLQFAGGGSSQSKKTLMFMASTLKMSVKCGLIGVLQGLGVLTCSSPLMRAAQACSEKIKPKGVLIPCGPERSLAQRILGLNSWEDQTVSESAPKDCDTKSAPTTTKDKADAPAEKVATESPVEEFKLKPTLKIKIESSAALKRLNCPIENETPNQNAEADAWDSLVARYLQAKTIEEMDLARNEMALRHTRRYINALNEASRKKSRKEAA